MHWSDHNFFFVQWISLKNFSFLFGEIENINHVTLKWTAKQTNWESSERSRIVSWTVQMLNCGNEGWLPTWYYGNRFMDLCAHLLYKRIGLLEHLERWEKERGKANTPQYAEGTGNLYDHSVIFTCISH